mgnify:CR=1 FL=1
MKEDSLEIYMELLENLIEYSENFYKQNGRSPIFLRKNQVALKHILSDYKRVLKENEELLEVKVSASAHNRILELEKENEEWDRKFCDLQNLYFKLQDESELKRKEYQETYKDVREELKELKKENEELKNDYENLNNSVVVKNHCIKNSIPVQKVKDKISERQFELQQEYKDFEDDAILIVLQELLEGRK